MKLNVNGSSIPLNAEELERLIQEIRKLVVEVGLKPPQIEKLVVFRRMPPPGFIKITENVYVTRYSIAVKAGLFANNFVYEFMVGSLALAFMNTWETVNVRYILKIAEANYMRILSRVFAYERI